MDLLRLSSAAAHDWLYILQHMHCNLHSYRHLWGSVISRLASCTGIQPMGHWMQSLLSHYRLKLSSLLRVVAQQSSASASQLLPPLAACPQASRSAAAFHFMPLAAPKAAAQLPPSTFWRLLPAAIAVSWPAAFLRCFLLRQGSTGATICAEAS